jgi:nucleoid-associated protein YgaU
MKGETKMKRALMVLVVVGVAAMLATGCSQKKDDTLQPVEAGKAPAIVAPKNGKTTVEKITTPAKTTPAKTTPVKTTATKTDTTKKQEYTVKAGDTLSAIAKKFYGDETLWKKIADANKDKVKNVDKITIGEVLVIPAK